MSTRCSAKLVPVRRPFRIDLPAAAIKAADGRHIGITEAQSTGGKVLTNAFEPAGSRDDDVALVEREGQCDLMHSGVMADGDGLEYGIAGAGAAGQRQVAGDGDVVAAAMVDQLPILQVGVA